MIMVSVGRSEQEIIVHKQKEYF